MFAFGGPETEEVYTCHSLRLLAGIWTLGPIPTIGKWRPPQWVQKRTELKYKARSL